jgi:hypothetical protein
MPIYDEERLAALLRLLRPAPAGWAEAAKELPIARRSLDGIVARAEADAEYRKQVVAGLEAALEREGVEPDPRLVDELRKRLETS